MRGKLHSKYSNEKLVGNQQSLSFNVEDETDGEIFEQVVNKKSSPEMIDEIILDIEPDLQPPNTIQGQITDEGEAAEIHYLMMQEDSIPLCYEAFQFIRQNLRNIPKGKDDSSVNCFIDQQVEDFHMAGNDERRSFVSDLVEIKDDIQENYAPISDNGDDKSDQETDGEEEKESCMVEAASPSSVI